MNDEVLNNIWNYLTSQGQVQVSFEEWKNNVANSPEIQIKIHEYLTKKGKLTNTLEEWQGKTGLKKKEEEEIITDSDTETGSSDSPEYESVLPSVIAETEKDTALERTFGKWFLTDYFGDIYRAVDQGITQGAAVDDALKLFGKGKDVTQADVQAFIAANNALANTPESDEMQKFNQDFEKAGGGMFGFLKALVQNRFQVAPQLFFSSVAAMLNPSSLAAAGGAIATGVAGGATMGSAAGGVGAIPGAVGGFISSLPYAIGAAGGTLETALSYSEFLQEEVEKNGKEFTQAAVMEVLNDPDAVLRIKSKAVGRGLTIGMIDAFSAGLAGKAVKSMGSAAKGATRAKRAGQQIKRYGAATGIEGVGGSLGEAGARLVAGQEMDVREIGFEGIAGTATAPFSFAYGQLISQPKYKINGGLVDRVTAEEAVEKYSDKDFAAAEISIENDPELLELATKRKNKLRLRDLVLREGELTLSKLPVATQEKVIELEIERKQLQDKTDKGSQLRLREIDEELEGLYGLDTSPGSVKIDLDETEEETPSRTEEIKEKFGITEEKKGPVVTEGKLGKKPRGEEVSNAVENQITEVISETTSENISEQKDKIFRSIAKPLNTPEARKKAFLDLVASLSAAVPTTDSQVSKTKIGRLKAGIQKTTFNSPDKVRNTLEKIVKTFDTPERQQLYKESASYTQKIKGLIKRGRKRLDANLLNSAEEFLKINPLEVTDLKEYTEKARQVAEGLKPTRLTKAGINKAAPFVINDIVDYTTKQLKNLEIKRAKINQDAFQELTGVSPEELSLAEINEVLANAYNESVTNPDEFIKNEISKISGKKQIINTAVDNAFKQYKTIIQNQIDTGVDVFTGNKVNLTPRQKRIVQDFMEIDVTKLSTAEKLKAIDAIVNFATNSDSGGMLATTAVYKGGVNAEVDAKSGLRSSSVKNIVDEIIGSRTGLYWSKNIASLPIMSEFMFGNQNDSRKFFESSGLQKIINGVADAERVTTAIGDLYHAKFERVKPNNQDFYSPENVTERGMFGFLNRTVVGTEAKQQEYFADRKNLIEESIIELRNGTPLEQQKAEDYQKVYDRILKDAKNIQDVKDKTHIDNIAAVDFIINEWAEIYQDLKNHSSDIYNYILDNDLNFVSDTMTLLEGVDAPGFDAPILDDSNLNKRKLHDKKTGVLEPNQRLKSLKDSSKKRYVNLDFDQQQVGKLRKALTDLNTGEAIRQLKGYTESDAFTQIIPDKTVREAFVNRMKEYVNNKRANKFISEESRRSARRLNRVITLGVSRVLGSLGQYPKQLVPLSNTAVNAGGKNTYFAIKEFSTNKQLREWIKALPFDIANRGIEAEALLDSYVNKIEKESRTKTYKAIDKLDQLQNWWIKQMLINPDKIAANASWVAYYGKAMKAKGVDVFTEGFDWSKHEVDTEAGNYAQQQVDRQQNTSQRDLQGAWFRSDDQTTRILTKLFIPFSNFLLNQKSRMYSDLNTLTNKNSNIQDRKTAARSLGGLGVETVVFNAIGLGLTMGAAALSNMLGAPEEDPEKLEEQTANRLKGRLGNVAGDILSPLPPLDDVVRRGLNSLIESISSDENPFEFYTSTETLLEDLGLGSIIYEKGVTQPFQLLKTMLSGTYNGKELDAEHFELAQTTAVLWPLYISGALPAEVGSIINYNLKRIKDSTN